MKHTFTMKTLAICAVLALAFAVPAHAGKACSASLNLKTCASTLNSVLSNGTDLTLMGVLKALNSGSTPGSIVSVVANLQTKDRGGQYETIATVTSCGAGLLLNKTLPLAVPGGAGDVCGGNNEQDIGFTVMFSGVNLASGTPARLELQVTYDGAPNGSAIDPCGANSSCNGLRIISVRFGFVVP